MIYYPYLCFCKDEAILWRSGFYQSQPLGRANEEPKPPQPSNRGSDPDRLRTVDIEGAKKQGRAGVQQQHQTQSVYTNASLRKVNHTEKVRRPESRKVERVRKQLYITIG